MTTTTSIIRSLPQNSDGVPVICTSSTELGRWVPIAPSANSDMLVVGLAVQSFEIVNLDTTIWELWEVGFGYEGEIVTRAQFSNSTRNDTAVGYLFNRTFFLPEPIEVPKFTRISVRYARSLSSATASRVKLLVMDDTRPKELNESTVPQNFQNIRGASGISVTERGFN